VCSVAVIEVYQPKLLSRDLNFAAITYRSHGPSASWSTPFMCGCYFLSVLGPWWRGITRAGWVLGDRGGLIKASKRRGSRPAAPLAKQQQAAQAPSSPPPGVSVWEAHCGGP
jgi:hypothetical protein